jgi:uncharacterized protein YutE (UPF0331/DUF86 family)
MTDPELLAKKLAFIETCVRELRELADLGKLDSDLRERRFVERTLQLAIQAALDVASHIASDQRLGEPRTQRELFELLVKAAWLPVELLDRLRAMAGFRNVLVHGYADVELELVREVVENHLPDLELFAASVRNALRARGER